jgi:O-methyltransferase involved in polyketide biosynthesis
MIRPTRELRGIDMPTKSQERVLTLQWRPIFKYMEGVLRYSIPDKVDEAVSYIWESAKDEQDLATLKLASWSKKDQRSEILKYGTAADKLHLLLETARNKPNKRKREGWTQTPKTINKVPRAGSKKIGDRSN